MGGEGSPDLKLKSLGTRESCGMDQSAGGVFGNRILALNANGFKHSGDGGV